MKKKLWRILVTLLVFVAILFVPIPTGKLKDGGTTTYSALTYKFVSWNRIYKNGVYHANRIYFGADARRSIDELWAKEEATIENTFKATIVEKTETSVLLEPLADQWERLSTDRIMLDITALHDIEAKIGDVVDVTYLGGLSETYPAQIKATDWALFLPISTGEYIGEWLNKEAAEKCDYPIFSDIVITEIYDNCFFARTVIPMPYTIKLNGTLSEDWCVGDQVICKYENTYVEGDKIECDVLTIETSTWKPNPFVGYKPVIYLYPERKIEATVNLTLNGTLTCTYPSYGNGWTVTADPDGTLTDAKGQTYNYLYWEGETNTQYDFSKGFCVKGEDTAAFLEVALEKLGLTRREANEFIVFWLPMMQNNAYNIIAFQGDAYTDSAKLAVSPSPDTLIRVFMAWQSSNIYVNIPEQELEAPYREGFTVVEWGGTKIETPEN